MSNVTPINNNIAKQIALVESFQRAAMLLDKFDVVRMRTMNEAAKYRHMNAITDMIVDEIACDDKHKKFFENATGNFLLRVMELVETLDIEDVNGHKQIREAAKIPFTNHLKTEAVNEGILQSLFMPTPN